jgi:hypothetical protein
MNQQNSDPAATSQKQDAAGTQGDSGDSGQQGQNSSQNAQQGDRTLLNSGDGAGSQQSSSSGDQQNNNQQKGDDAQGQGDQNQGDGSKQSGDGNSQAPEKYEIKVGEGIEMDQEALEKFTPVFKDLGLSNEGAQKLVDAYVPVMQEMAEKTRQKALTDYNKMTDEWKQDTMKQLGDSAKESLAVCSKAIDAFGSSKLRELLDETRLGNHPEMVNFMLKVGKTIKEDDFVKSDKKVPGHSAQERLDRMYPSMQE